MSNLPESLLLGDRFVGPSYYGCSNTGLEPAILHSRWLVSHPDSNHGFRFVIGPDVYLQQAAKMLVAGVVKDQTFVEFGNDIRVTFARDYETAKTRFAFLVQEIAESNARMRARHKALFDKARAGDTQAVVELGDF